MFCLKQKTAYEMRIGDWSSDVCSSDLRRRQQEYAILVDAQRCVRAPVFLFEDQPFDQVTAAPAVLLGPGHRAPTAFEQLGFPIAMRGKAGLGIEADRKSVV